MTTHELKTDPSYFGRIRDGVKTFEIRRHDRDYKVGDRLLLREYDKTIGMYTFQDPIVARVTYILTCHEFDGIASGYCAMSISVNDDAKPKVQVRGYGDIPWSLHEKAWFVWNQLTWLSCSLTAKDVANDGGFSIREMDAFVPGWRAQVDIIRMTEENEKSCALIGMMNDIEEY